MTIHTSHRNAETYTGGDVGAALSQSIHNKPKYHLRAGLLYLFWDCTKLTDNRDWAWKGTIEQARACRRKFDAAAGCKARLVTALPVHQEEEA